jgi:hypothetical protein
MKDSTITVTLSDGSWFEFSISTNSNGDKKFYDKLIETWERNKEDSTVKDQQTANLYGIFQEMFA